MLGFRKLCLRLCCFELQTWSPMKPNIYLLKYISFAYFHMAMRTHCRVLQTAISAGLLFCQEASIYTRKLLNDTTHRHQWWILVDPFPQDMLPSAQEKPFHGEKTGDWYLFRWGWPQVAVPQETRQLLLLALHPSCASTACPTPLYKPILPSVL